MDVFNVIQMKLRDMRDKGMTQKEISEKSGISQPFISQLLNPSNGSERISHLELIKFFKLFPTATITFDDGISNSAVVQGDRNVVTNTVGCPPSADGDLLKLIMASADIDAETKVRIWNLANGAPHRDDAAGKAGGK